MSEEFDLRSIPKNLSSNYPNLGDLGTNTAQTNRTSQTQPLVVTAQDIPQDLKTLILSLPALETPSIGGSSTPNLEHLLATLQKQTEDQEYQQKLQMIINAGNITSAKNADALVLMDKMFNTVAQGNICAQTGIVMGYLLAAKEANVPVEQYLEDNKITMSDELKALLAIAQNEIKAAPEGASLSSIVSNILKSAGEATQTTFTDEELAKYSADISSELMEVHTSGQEAREAHQGEVDTANANQTAAESSKKTAEQLQAEAQKTQQTAEDNLQSLKDETGTLKTQKENAQTAYDNAVAAEKEPKENAEKAQTDLDNAKTAQKNAEDKVTEANKALEDFDTQNGDPEKLTDSQKMERQQLVDNLNAAENDKKNADTDVTNKTQARDNAKKELEDAETVTSAMQEELNKAQASLNENSAAIGTAEIALTKAKAAAAAAEINVAQKTQALNDANTAVKAAINAQNDAAMAAINKAFGEYVDACVAMGLMEAEKRQEEERLQKQDAEKEQLAEDIKRYIKKMNLTIKTPPEQLAEILTALLNHQAEFLDMMGQSKDDSRDIEREIYQKETI